MPSARLSGHAEAMRVVIVDDNVEFIETARRVLERDGLTVVGAASTGAEALRCAQEQDPDVILVDVNLGEENGFDVASRLSAATGRRRSVILISAYCPLDLEELLDVSPAIGFVSKARLSATAIAELLDLPSRSDGSQAG
jgi:CheY-like chemotaxis protein